MTGIPTGPLGFIASLALRFPKTAASAMGFGKWARAHWKAIAITVAVVSACVSAFIWFKHDQAVQYNAGFGAAQAQAKAAVDAANKVAQNDQHQLDLLKVKYDDLSKARQTQVVTVTKPIIERVTHEVQAAPVYRDCKLTDGVFNDLQTEAAGVNASIGSSQR
jgi:hypothetical protein